MNNRLLIRCALMYVNPMKFGSLSTVLTRRHIYTSCGCLKQSQISDDINDDINNTPMMDCSQMLKMLKRKTFINIMGVTMNCPTKLAEDIWFENPQFKEKAPNDIKLNVNLLTLKGVRKSVILDNPSLLAVKKALLCSRLHILESMNPVNIEDFVPLATLSDKQLLTIKTIAEEEDRVTPDRHRIYHFSKLLDVQPHIFCKFMSKKPFVLNQPFDIIDGQIKEFLKHENPKKFFQLLWLIDKSSQSIRSRLTQANELNMKLNKSLALPESKWWIVSKQAPERDDVARGRSVAQYFADRLDCEIEKIEEILRLHGIISKMDLAIVDKKLDYLLNEARFKKSDIVLFPNILGMSLEKMKKRIPELQSHGCSHTHILDMVYRIQRKYDAFLNAVKKQKYEKTGQK